MMGSNSEITPSEAEPLVNSRLLVAIFTLAFISLVVYEYDAPFAPTNHCAPLDLMGGAM